MKHLLTLLVVTVASAGIFVGASADQQPRVEKGGTLHLYEDVDGGGDTCTIDILPGKHAYYMGGTNCGQDEASSYSLEKMSSAVWILFGSENFSESDGVPRCPFWTNVRGWRERIKILKNPMPDSPIKSFEDLSKIALNSIIQPGYIRDYSTNHGGVGYQGKLSCVLTVWCPTSMDQPCDGKPPTTNW